MLATGRTKGDGPGHLMIPTPPFPVWRKAGQPTLCPSLELGSPLGALLLPFCFFFVTKTQESGFLAFIFYIQPTSKFHQLHKVHPDSTTSYLLHGPFSGSLCICPSHVRWLLVSHFTDETEAQRLWLPRLEKAERP